jgi:hypothetical protein
MVAESDLKRHRCGFGALGPTRREVLCRGVAPLLVSARGGPVQRVEEQAPVRLRRGKDPALDLSAVGQPQFLGQRLQVAAEEVVVEPAHGAPNAFALAEGQAGPLPAESGAVGIQATASRAK